MKDNTGTQEFSFQDILTIFNEYKWSILFITLTFMGFSYVYLYFKPSIYSSYAIIKINPHKIGSSNDLINNSLSTNVKKDVIEEISLLKTYKINKNVLNKIHLKVQYFIDDEYKKVEIFQDIPIEISSIKIFDKKILNKKIIIIPEKDGFKLHFLHTFKEKLKKTFLDIPLSDFDNTKIYKYNTLIKTKYFELFIKKNKAFTNTLYFLINGNSRNIFETMVKKNLHVSQLKKDTSLIKIAYDDTIPERAHLYVESLTNSFIEYSINSKNSQNAKTLNFILKELKEIKIDLKNSESQLEDYQRSQSILNPSMKANLFIKKLSDIEIQLSENELKQKLISNLISFVKNNYNLDAIAPSLTKIHDANTLHLITKLQDKQLLEEELATEYTDAYPKLQSIRKQISNIRFKIAENLKSLQINIQYQNQNLQKRKNSYEVDLKILPAQEKRLINIKRNYEVKSKMYEYLLKKKSENKIIQLATFSDYKIIDNAYTSNKPILPKKKFILLMSLFLGFIIASIITLIRYSKNNKIQNKADLEKLTSLPIYGSIPFYKHKSYSLEVTKKVKSPFTEAFRTLRTNLQFLKKEKKSISILITSTIAGEGKSTTVANLASILDKAKYKTVIVNLDLRKPSLHKFFYIDNSIGVTSYLNGNNNLSEIIMQTEFGQLDIIPSGPIPENPSELILSPKLPELIKELKTMYEYVIVDTAPIGIVTDTKTIMQYSDLNLILLRANYAKADFITTLESMIANHDFKNIGLILNATKEEGGEYGYGYSYEYE